MTQTDLELAGLARPDGSGLGHAFAGGRYLAPALVEADGEVGIHWAMSSEGRGPHRRVAHPQTLAAFSDLADADAAQVVAFARRWGVLNTQYPPFCGHRHGDEPRVLLSRGAKPSSPGTMVVTIGPASSLLPESGAECLACWRALAWQTRSALNEVAIVRKLPSVRPAQRRHAARMVQALIDMTYVRPRLMWDAEDAVVTLSGAGLMGAISMLVLTAVFGQGLAMCANCGQWHSPMRPQSDRRSYCLICRQSGAPERDASRDYRRRQRKTAST